MLHEVNDVVILTARIFLALLFLIFGWRKIRDYPGTVSQMAQDRLPMPGLAAAIAIFMERPVSIAIAIGLLTQPLAILVALYTLGTSLAEHRFWRVRDAHWLESMENFFKNLAIMGGFLLLFVTGGGKYSVDSWLGISVPW
ncbi:MAG TPA: DoxX family protein [Bradyrhizobium sp.]|nr:DoxX family protein [Bradyrhizobium sp.]